MRSLHRHSRWRGITTSTILITLLQYAYLASAIPTITFPINSQVPPVARPNTPFNFTFSPSTFSSNLPLTYTLASGPGWLSLDSTTRTLSGTPPESEAGTAPLLEIEARDDSGAVTLTSTLVVRSDLAPEVAVPLRDQIKSFGTDVSAPDALLFYPSTAFRFQFSADTFKDTGGNGLTLYAVTLENTPLPSWITFDAGTMTFNGQTPDSGSLVAPPELFGIQLIASDVLGFAGASVPFYFVVQNQMLVWEQAFVEVNATIGEALSYSGLNGKLMLDGNVVGNGGVKVTSNAPDWLALGEDFSLSGTIPENTTDFDVQVEATDEFNDVASVIVSFSISSGLFVDEDIAPLNATIGDKFEYDVRQAFISPDQVSIAVLIEPQTPWLFYNPTTMILSGEVPDDADVSSINVTITGTAVTTLSKRATESKTIVINVVPSFGTASPSSSGTSPIASTTSLSPSGTSSSESEAATFNTRRGLSPSEIAIAVVIPNVVLILALLAIYCCLRRKKHEKLLDKFTIIPKGSKGKRNISPPIVHDGQNILSESSTTLSDHPGLRSHPVHPVYRSNRDTEDTDVESEASFYPRRSVPRRSATFSRISQYLSSFTDSELASQHENHGLRRSVSANYVVHGEKSWPTTKDRSSMPNAEGSRLSRDFSINEIGVAKTDKRKTVERSSGWKYKPYRTFSERSVLSSEGSVQITPERQYMPPRTSWYGMPNREASRKSKTRNYIGSIAGISMKPDGTKNNGIGHGRNVSSVSNFSLPHQHPTMRPFGPQPGHGQWQSVDSDRTWQTVPSSPKKQFNTPMRPPSAMSALTENTDLLFSDILPPVLSSARDSPSSNYDTNTPVANSSLQAGGSQYADPATIRVVSKSSMQRPSSRGSNRTQISSTSAPSVARPVTRRGPGESPFFAGSSSRATSRAARQRSTKTLNYFAGYDSPTIQERDETNESLERSILEDLHVSPNTLNSMPNDVPRDSLGINYGDSSSVVNRKSRVCIPAAAFRSPSEATRQLGTFESDVSGLPSWNQGGAFAQNRQSVLSQVSDASSRYNEASSSPGIFSHNTSNSEDKENGDIYDTYFTKPIYPSRESQQAGGRASPYSAHSGPTPTNPSRATFRDSNLTSTSLHYGEDESPELGNAAFIQRPHSTFLRPGSRSHLNSVYPTQLSPGIDPSWRLTPVSPRPVDLGNGRLVSGPGRDVKGGLRNSHGREGSLSVGHFVVNGDKDKVVDEEEWMRRTAEDRRRAEREGTPGIAFL